MSGKTARPASPELPQESSHEGLILRHGEPLSAHTTPDPDQAPPEQDPPVQPPPTEKPPGEVPPVEEPTAPAPPIRMD
jgi:hypothetical protein